MNLFNRSRQTTDPAQVDRVKTWVRETLNLPVETAISISQLQCREPGCPPLETAIAVLVEPVQKYNIHKALADVTSADVAAIASTD